MSHGKLNQPQVRHYKDPALGKTSRGIAMTDDQYEKLKAAAKSFGRPMGEFVAALVDNYTLLEMLRAAERGK